MHLSTATLMFGIGLVAAAPRHQTSGENMPAKLDLGNRFHDNSPQSFETRIIASEPENGVSDTVIQVDITTKPHSSSKFSTPEMSTMSERIPGWLFLDGKKLQARIHGNTFWNIKGELSEVFPLEDYLFDPIVFSLSHPTDFEGDFTGKIGSGEFSLKWEKSGATMTGRSAVGDFTIKGSTHVDFSP